MQLADGRTVTADEAYLRDCILLPDKTPVAGFPPIMPNFSGASARARSSSSSPISNR